MASASRRSTSDTTTPPARPARSRRDALANRERIVAAARTVFAERGVDIALAEVAKEAGVGLATVTRHFDRTQLVEAVLVDRTDEHLALLEGALALPAEDGVAGYLETLCAQQVGDRSVCHALTLSLPDSPLVRAHRASIRDAQLRLIRRARRAGAIRAGVVPEDFVLVFQAIYGVIQATEAGAPGAWRRVLAVILAGLGVTASESRLPGAPGGEQLQAALSAPKRGRRTSALKPA